MSGMVGIGTDPLELHEARSYSHVLFVVIQTPSRRWPSFVRATGHFLFALAFFTTDSVMLQLRCGGVVSAATPCRRPSRYK